MSDPTAERLRAQREAADWFARLSHVAVSNDALRDFQAWRRADGNAAAYRDVEAAWTASGALAADPEIRQAAAEALRRRPARTPPARRAAPPGLALALIGLVGVATLVGYLVLQRGPTYSTQVGEQRLVVLSDGSRMRLNTDSRAQVRYRAGERRVELARGEAFFEVTHDASRPFVVHADGAQVRALGTKFDVWRDGPAVRVSLLEGRVRVAQANGSAGAILNPNQRLTVSAKGISAPEPTDAFAAAGWTTGQLTFRAVPLAQAVAEINRYGRRKVSLQVDPAVARQPVSGSFNAGDTTAFVQAVRSLFDLNAVTDADGDVRLVAPASSGD